MQTFSTLGSVVLLIMHVGLSSVGSSFPPTHMPGTGATASSACAQAHQTLRSPSQHWVGLDAHGSLLWQSMYPEPCCVKILCGECGVQATSRQLPAVVLRRM
jgi:hypothetical protein